MLKANKFLAIIALFFFVVSMGSCGGGGGGGGGTTTTGNDSASAVIGPTGGTLTTPSGNATLSVPADTLSTNTTITISQSTEGDLPGGIIGSYEFKPDGLTFNAPVKISLKYDPTLIPEGINEGNLKLAYESGGDWIIISDSNVDTTNHIVSGQTTHFTKYSITSEKLPYDTFIGDFNSVKINSNGDITNVSNDYYSVDGVTTGMKWQCVEYVNRYYLQVYNKNIRIPGTDAKDYYKTATDRELSAYPNDGSVSPQPGDILVSEGGTYGHVAIVREVTENRVYVTQQNWFNGNGDVKAPLSKVGNHLDGFGGSKTYTIKGWLRLPASTTDTIPPSVPTGLTATAISSSQIDLSWTASTDYVGVTGYSIWRDGVLLKTVTGTSASNTGLSASTQYCYTVSAYDSAGNESGQSGQVCATTLALDSTPPIVSSTSPANNTTNVAVNTAISATFSETMAASTINTTTFTLSGGITGTVTYTGTTATFTPSSNLSYSTPYTATITTGVKDAAGNAMAANYTWSFTTGALMTVTDIDGNVYNTVTIDTQVWMKENLKVTKYRNGDAIGTTTPATLDISGETSPKYQWAYDGNESNVATYGRLYTWYAVTDSRAVCPTGWHVPSDTEWTTLTDYLGGESVAGGKMKEAGTTHWNTPNTGADNSSGWTALPGGGRYDGGAFDFIGYVGSWWSASEFNASYAWHRYLRCNSGDAYRYSFFKYYGFSVRCVRD